MKRILVLMTVVVLMMAMSVAPAFATWDAEGGACKKEGDRLTDVSRVEPGLQSSLPKVDRNDDGWVCHRGDKPFGKQHFYDNQLV